MTFFATSTGSGAEGGNLGGLAGADAKCKALATAVGGGDHTWKAYLSANAANGGVKVDAKDRIGAGPWKNQKGVVIAATVAALHAANFNPKTADIIDEKGVIVPANRHDMLTGSNARGESVADTCANWTATTTVTGLAAVGHTDSELSANNAVKWNSAHSIGCSQASLNVASGEGRFYCFATD